MNEGEKRDVLRKYDHMESKDAIERVFKEFYTMRQEKGLDIVRKIIKDIDKAHNPLLVLPPEMLSHLILFLEVEEIVFKRSPFLIHPNITQRLMDYSHLWFVLYERCTKEPLKRKPEFQLSNVRFFVKNFCFQKTFKLRRSRSNYIGLNNVLSGMTTTTKKYESFPKNLILVRAEVREENTSYDRTNTCDVFRELEYFLWNEKEATFTAIGLLTQALFFGRSSYVNAEGGSESIRATINGIHLFEIFLWQPKQFKNMKRNTITCHVEGFRELEKVLELFKKAVVFKGSFKTFAQTKEEEEKYPVLRKILYCICLLFQVLDTKNEETLQNFIDLGETPSTIKPENVFVKRMGRTMKQRMDVFLKTERFFEDDNF